jgi:uncharacterized protein DUF6933
VITVRGTKKFLVRVGRPTEDAPPSTGRLGDWYANPWFWRPQVVLFVSERSLLPVLLPLAPAATVIERFPAAFAEVVKAIGVDDVALNEELAEMEEVVLAKTASRSILGTMNEFSYLADNYRWRHDEIELLDVSLWLARVPSQLRSGGFTPEDKSRELLR